MKRRLLLCLMLLPWLAYGANPAQVTLINQDGEDFQLQSLQGKVVLMAFGFTNCGMVCPIEMGRLSTALRQLEDKEDRVHAVFITVDRERDTPAVIKEYIARYHSNITGLTGTQAALDQVSDHYRVKRKKLDNGDIDHGAALFVLDDHGEVQAAVPPGLPPSHIVQLVNDLLAAR